MHTNPYHLTPASRALILLRSMQIRSRLARLREQRRRSDEVFAELLRVGFSARQAREIAAIHMEVSK